MIKLREMMDQNRKHITHLRVPGHMGITKNEQADQETKAALDDDTQQKEEHKDQKRAIEKRKQQHERKKDRTRI
jgi:ribonuclease HI